MAPKIKLQNETETHIQILLTPAGHLVLRGNTTNKLELWLKKIITAFSSCPASGLFALAVSKSDNLLSPSFSFWRDFSCHYLNELCRIPEQAGKQFNGTQMPDDEEWSKTMIGAPPMQGGEYLNAEILRGLWCDLDAWVRKDVLSFGKDLSDWLKKKAPQWHQVGRVCFHLAENKRDSSYPFAFMATYAPRLSKSGRVQYQPLGKALQEYAGEKNKDKLIELLTPVHQASEKSSFVKDLVDSNDIFHPLAWTPQEAHHLLKEVSLLEESGLVVRLPDWWRKRSRPNIAVTIGQKKQSLLGTDGLLDFNVDIALGDKKLTQKEWQQLMKAEDGLLYLKGQWVEVDKERLNEALSHWKQVEKDTGDGISFIEGMRMLAGAPIDLDANDIDADHNNKWSTITAGSWLSNVLSDMRNTGQLTKNKKIKNFRGTLRHYQEAGHNWLWLLSNLGLGACLADDMGLGKTIQILSLLLSFKNSKKSPHKPSLLVLPASLIANWKAEIEKFAPTLSACFVHPSETDKNDLKAMAKNPSRYFSKTDIVLTTYGMLLRQEWLLDIKWKLAILDEAQAIKNPGTRQTRAVKKIKAQARIALTGTPVENRLSDLWSLFDFLCPGLLGSTDKFKKFVKAMDQQEHDSYAPLRNLVSPYILRRLKTDKSIISDLPDKTEIKVHCGLAKEQATLYKKSVNQLAQALEADDVDGIKRQGLVLSYLIRFKQICNHPSQLLGDGLYSHTVSGKFDRLRSICEEISSRQEKVLIFTQFREIIDPLENFLAEIFGRGGLKLHGGTAVKKRKSLVDAFQKENGPPFFVLSLKAGGTGLNLTAASHVVHFDRWWNPAVENQATDRAFRIGQKRNVLIHKFTCKGTIEEKIDMMIEEKMDLADGLLKGGAERMLTEMNDKELLDLVSLDIEQTKI